MRFSNKMFLLIILAILLSFSAADYDGNTWTRFRGNDGSGIDLTENLPVKWDSTSYAWRINLPGVGNASPVVWGNRIFVTSSDDQNDLGYAIAIDEHDGSIVWQKEFTVTDLKMHVDNNLASPTPAVDESQVYFIWYSNNKTVLMALNHNGGLNWETQFEGIESRHGGGSSLMLTDELVIFTREQEDFSSLKSSWVAVDKVSGETVWELERESAEANSFATPLLIINTNQTDQLIFASQAHGVTSLNPEDGEPLWERKELLPARVVASPIYSDGFLVVCRKGGALVMELPLNGSEPADTALYELPRNLSPYVPTPIIVGEFLYVFTDNGTVACLHLATGEIKWKERPAGPIYGSPVCVGGNIYCITKEGEVIVLSADSSFELLGINSLGEGSFSTPVMTSSGMVFRTFSQLMKL
ncbi:MAG: PQQ-binding-like beta-propeller repeat protein [Bacteroidales bacterium]|nr:PQQ-binding-like beta-propeller repeat protein [Bacteroidales bacterium]MCF8405376.1 PQQ-binding-like beta-propeller repeat protein [Bacteroidales bacterium]